MTTTTLDKPIKAPTFRDVSTSRRIRNHLATGLVWLCFAIALIPLAWVLIMVVSKGFESVISIDWWQKSQKGILPDQSGGGVYHAIYGTIVQSAIAAVIAVPIGIMAAVYLVEYGRGWLAKTTTFMVDILAGVPSIVAALFIFALWIATFGAPQSAFAVALAMVLLMLPVVVRSTEEMLKLVPDELREAAYALGVPKWKTIARIVIPTALPGMISGILLALARVMGETAPVLVLVGYSKSINSNVFDGNMASLPLMIYQELANPEPEGRARVWGAALTLILLIALLYAAAAVVNKLLTRNR
ncbi:phosphate ABC transporter permease PstA [Nocardia ninae]|uniref:Phosphate transport system permease protein PstA n=1 Tax=Nocardia ninae NBRC 108245 TaxID=1210091 RepID=A0A511MEK2_9NOCA|nr:phosphate ABC transporter permease PstA [Nocardia ninae]GEM38577.1 phosphate transport system permease protein PstA [Nocardia ninae NBRC 108245]